MKTVCLLTGLFLARTLAILPKPDRDIVDDVMTQLKAENISEVFLSIDKTSFNEKTGTSVDAQLHLLIVGHGEKRLVSSYTTEWWKTHGKLITVLPEHSLISIDLKLDIEDFDKLVRFKKLGSKEGEEPTYGPVPDQVLEKENLDWFKTLTQGTILQVTYQKGEVKSDFSFKRENEKSDCLTFEFFASNTNGVSSFHIPFCKQLEGVTEDQRDKKMRDMTKKLDRDMFGFIRLYGIAPKEIFDVHSKMKTKVKETKDGEKDGEEKKDGNKDGEKDEKKKEDGNKGGDKDGEKDEKKKEDGNKDEDNDADKRKDGNKDKDKKKGGNDEKKKDEAEDSKDTEGNTDEPSKDQELAFYQRGWFIAILIVFGILLIASVVLGVIVFGKKNTTLDYSA